MKIISRIFAVLVLLVVVAAGIGLSYVLPRHAVVNINGHDVKRIDQSGAVVDARNPAKGVTRDVFFINASNLAEKEVYVFRNEDTRFGFPWYFKFDSAEVQARSQLIEAEENRNASPSYALVTYYGWRMPMFNLFPNAVDVRPWESAEPPFPVFNTVFLSVLALIVLVIWWKLWRWKRRRAAAKKEKELAKAKEQQAALLASQQSSEPLP